MKVATETPIQAQADTIWKTLLDFPAYSEWNRFIKAVRGEAAPDAKIEVDLQYYGQPVQREASRITGFIEPKYLSWEWNHSLGAWFLAIERVFRIKQHEDGKVVFHQETYYTGMGLRFRRKTIERIALLSMEKMCDDLKERLEAVRDI